MINGSQLEEIEVVVNKTSKQKAESYGKGRLPNEDALTVELLERIAARLNNKTLDYFPVYGVAPVGGSLAVPVRLKTEYFKRKPPVPPVQLSMRKTEDRFVGSEENASGADIVVSFKVDPNVEDVHKSFLAQAKIYDRLDDQEINDLREKCRKMLNVCPGHSYVFIYHQHGVMCLKADVVLLKSWRPPSVLINNFGAVIKDFLACDIGDHDIKALDGRSFYEFLEKMKRKHGLNFDLVSPSTRRGGSRKLSLLLCFIVLVKGGRCCATVAIRASSIGAA